MYRCVRPISRALFMLGLSTLLAGPALAAWPDRPIRLIVAFPPGGGTDIVARLLVPELSRRLGQPITIDNRGGAGGNIGTDAVAKSPPDGYTLLMGNIAPNAINASTFRHLPYDPEKDFSPISLVAVTPNILVVNPSVAVNSVAELIALAKAKPGSMNYPSAGRGTSSHLAGELFNTMAKTEMVHVPYKGGGPAFNDLLGGQVQLFFATMPAAMPFVKAGKLRPLAVTSSQRSTTLPNLPTISESGLPGYSAVTWYGLLAPKGTPPEVVQRLNREINEILRLPATNEQLVAQGFEPAGTSPAEFAAFIGSEIVKWGKVVKAAGITPE
jgi:tripartite-type tricarboxylate transporter receptor subunit TctC